MAYFGYFTFTDALKSNILDVFATISGATWYLHAANILMLCCMAAHYPLPCFGLRRTVESLFWHDQDAPTGWRIFIAFCLIVVTGLIGSFVKEIHQVLDYTSSLAGSCHVFIFPGLFGLALWRMKGGKMRLCMSITVIVTGVFIMVTGLTCTIYTTVVK